MACVWLPLPGKSEGNVMCLELEEENWIMSRDDLLCQVVACCNNYLSLCV